MNVLVLEDDPNRQAKFKLGLIGTNFAIVATAQDAIRLLQTKQWDYLFLDHDLGGMQMCASGPNTGYGVATWLRDHPDRKPKCIIIHSLNPAGAANIKLVLREAVLAPGCWDSIIIEDPHAKQ
jgi:CheY-like chemotaxis protein